MILYELSSKKTEKEKALFLAAVLSVCIKKSYDRKYDRKCKNIIEI